ncbi:MAG TPA: protein translocase subunit SecF [Dehalococcoidia bacterium]|nr:protein translocase subunit SecF [Dehalococcoidia bacterium]
MLNLVARRNWFYLFSLALLIPGAISLMIPPRLKPGIEFTSGTTFSFRYADQTTSDQVKGALSDLGHPEARVQRTGTNQFLVQTEEIQGSSTTPPVGPSLPSERETIESALSKQHGGFLDTAGNPTTQFIEFSSVSAAVSRQIGRNAALAVLVASIAITLYITWSFSNVPNSLRYGVSAIVALLHDVLLVIGVFSILGKALDVKVDTFFITGVLTVVGFSVHDSIVVFDRVRENVARGFIRNFPDAVNHSLLQTMGRSFNTSLTLIFSILALLLLGGSSIRDFLLVLLIGVATGTYSSVFIASMLLVTWQQGDIPRWWRRVTGRPQRPAPVPAAPAE